MPRLVKSNGMTVQAPLRILAIRGGLQASELILRLGLFSLAEGIIRRLWEGL